MPIIHREDGVPPSKARMVLMGGSFNDTVPSTGSHTVTFTPPRGKRWQIINMRLYKGSTVGSTSGYIKYTIKQGLLNMIKGESNFGSAIDWNTNRWEVADKAQIPATNEAMLMALHAVVADADTPLTIVFNNVTDADNSRTGEIYVHVLETPII